MKKELPPKQTRFVEEYLVDLNATAAATRAGYSPKTAYSMGQRLLKKDEVQEAINEAKLKRSKRTEVTQDHVLLELARIAFSDIREVVNWSSHSVELIPSEEILEDAAAAIAEVAETKFGLRIKLFDKLRALEKLGDHLGMFHPEEGKERSPREIAREIRDALTEIEKTLD